jgi:thiamine biosynthesis lipoprotein
MAFRRPAPDLRMRAAVALLVAGAAGACSGSTVPSAPGLVERSRLTMGSELTLSAWTAEEAGALRAFEQVFVEFDRLDALMSVWREQSDVVRLNAAAGTHPVPVSREVLDVLRVARQVSEWTGGKFDVTFAALSDVWRFDHDQDNRIPGRHEIDARLPLVDYTVVEIDERAGTAFLKRKGARVHFGGIGKGYAVDRAADMLRRSGIRDFLIQSGGDLYAAGRRGDRPWRLGIRDPRGPADRSFAALDLSDGTFSTSGDYERFFIKDGRRYHHIIDPDRGEPAEGCRSVTIVTDRAVLADALSTGIFVLGPEAGLSLIEELPDVEGVIVSARNEIMISSGLRGRLILLAPPSDAP